MPTLIDQQQNTVSYGAPQGTLEKEKKKMDFCEMSPAGLRRNTSNKQGMNFSNLDV